MKMRTGMVIWFLAVALMLPGYVAGQDQGRYVYSQEQLDQLLAPIALYPDALLSQILMASTYPLEVVDADRWIKANRNLQGTALDDSLQGMSWDVSVKSLCHYPNVLSMMDQKLQQTTDLGNAFLGQQDQVMDTVQRLRSLARSQGNLVSSDKEKVIVEDRDIIIEPVYPDILYIPFYDPCWVFGPWWYPACSPLWFWYPSYVVGVGIFYGPAIEVGPLGFWCGFHWRHHSIFVDVRRTAVISPIGVIRMHGGVETWQHDPWHRRGISYRDSFTSQRFGRAVRPGVDARRPFRGFAPSPGITTTPGGVHTAPQSLKPQQVQPLQPRTEGLQRRGPGAFEGLGQSGPETLQHSQRGWQSLTPPAHTVSPPPVMSPAHGGGAVPHGGGPGPGGFSPGGKRVH